MDGVTIQQKSSVIQSSDEQYSGAESQSYQSQMPDQELLHSAVSDRTRLSPLAELTPQFMSGLYGYCLGNATAVLGDPDRDGWTVSAGLVLSGIAGVYALKMLKSAPKTETGVSKSYFVKHVSIFMLCAVAGSIVNWHNYC